MVQQDRFREPSNTGETASGTSVKEQVGQKTGEVAEQVQQKTSEVAEQVQQQTTGLVQQVRQQATSQLSSQKDRASQGLTSVAQVINQTGRQLRQQDQAAAASQYTDKAAEQIERFANYLQQKDVEEIIYDVEQFARRRPNVFLGAAFALGMLGSRFLKSSSRAQSQQQYGQQQYGQQQYPDYSTRNFERMAAPTPPSPASSGFEGTRVIGDTVLESDISGSRTAMPTSLGSSDITGTQTSVPSTLGSGISGTQATTTTGFERNATVDEAPMPRQGSQNDPLRGSE